MDKKKLLPILGILFLVGIIFLFLGEYHSNKGEGERPAFDEKAYTENLELRLGQMLEQMQGVSEVNVMITLEDTGEILVEDGDALQAGTLLMQVASPQIRGVSIVCQGAADPKTHERILNLVAGTLNLNKNKIYVTE